MHDTNHSLVTCTVLDIQPLHSGRVLALASVAIDIDGIVLEIHGLRLVRASKDGREAVGVEMPHYRAADGAMLPPVTLPDELKQPIGAAVLERSRELGIIVSAIRVR